MGDLSPIVFGETLLSQSLLGELDLFESLETLFCGLGSVDAAANITGEVLLLGNFTLDELSTLGDGEILVRAGRLPSEFAKTSVSSLRFRSGSTSTSPKLLFGEADSPAMLPFPCSSKSSEITSPESSESYRRDYMNRKAVATFGPVNAEPIQHAYEFILYAHIFHILYFRYLRRSPFSYDADYHGALHLHTYNTNINTYNIKNILHAYDINGNEGKSPIIFSLVSNVGEKSAVGL